jgi:flagellar biosynthetic protein FliR
MTTLDALWHSIDWPAAAAFGLVLARVSGAALGLPFFAGSNAPAPVRAILLILLTAAMYSGARPHLGAPPSEVADFIFAFLREFVVGLALGLVVRVVFAAIELAAQLIATQLGLTYGSIIHPETEHSEPSIVTLFHALGVLLFLAFDGHHLFLRSVQDSFALGPPGSAGSLAEFASALVAYGGALFKIGVQLSAPIVAAVLLSNVGLALASRATPQLGVFQLSFGVTILVGFAALVLAAPSVMSSFVDVARSAAENAAAWIGKP